jgi:hypothetical protein
MMATTTSSSSSVKPGGRRRESARGVDGGDMDGEGVLLADAAFSPQPASPRRVCRALDDQPVTASSHRRHAIVTQGRVQAKAGVADRTRRSRSAGRQAR